VKLLFDANLSPEVARLLKEAGYDAIHVRDIGLLSAPDPEILQVAASGRWVLITADSDFGALLALGDLASPSVLLLRSADHLRPADQAKLIVANLSAIVGDLERGAVASLTMERLRVRELPIREARDGE